MYNKSRKSALYKSKKVIADAKLQYHKKPYKGVAKRKYTRQYTNNYNKVLVAAMKTSQKLRFNYDDITQPTLTFAGGIPFVARNYTVNSLYNMVAGLPTTDTQAVAFRNWARFYSRYLVEMVTVDVEFVNLGQGPVYVGVAYKPINNEAWTTWSQYRNIESNTFPNKQELLTATGGSNDRTVIKIKCKLGDLWGIDTQQLGDVTFSGPVTGDPAVPQICSIFALAPSNQQINGSVVVCKVHIDLIATLYQLKLQIGGPTQ